MSLLPAVFREPPSRRRSHSDARTLYDSFRFTSIESVTAARSAQLRKIVPQFWQINLHLISFTFVEPQTSHTSSGISRNRARDREPAPSASAHRRRSSPLLSRRSDERCRALFRPMLPLPRGDRPALPPGAAP